MDYDRSRILHPNSHHYCIYTWKLIYVVRIFPCFRKGLHHMDQNFQYEQYNFLQSIRCYRCKCMEDFAHQLSYTSHHFYMGCYRMDLRLSYQIGMNLQRNPYYIHKLLHLDFGHIYTIHH